MGQEVPAGNISTNKSVRQIAWAVIGVLALFSLGSASGYLKWGLDEAADLKQQKELAAVYKPVNLKAGHSLQNAHFLLNFFWAVGLANKNSILTSRPMVQNSGGQMERFASTRGAAAQIEQNLGRHKKLFFKVACCFLYDFFMRREYTGRMNPQSLTDIKTGEST